MILYKNYVKLKMRFFQDHIQEVLDKWESIDDEIWAKVKFQLGHQTV